MSNSEQNHRIARTRMMSLISGYCISQAIACVTKLGVADQLANVPRSSAELASSIGCSATHLHRLLRALSEIGIFQHHNGTFSHTSMSMLLRRDDPSGMSSQALFHGEEMYAAFAKLHESLVSGTPAWNIAMGQSPWNYFSEHPARGALFDDTMRRHQDAFVKDLVSIGDLGTPRMVVDVGGGDGLLLQEVLAQFPLARGVLFDLPRVVTRARALGTWHEYLDRCEFVGGNLFSDVPKGADIYFLKNVLHDWDDAACIRILSVCRSALTSTSRILIVEQLMDNEHPRSAAWFDIGVMIFGGQERTLDEFRFLMTNVGLRIFSTRSTPLGHVLDVRMADE